MNAIEVLSKRKWRQNLKKRKYVGLFQIPKVVWENNKVNDGTKRLLKIKFNTGIILKGPATVTSGREIYIPMHLQHYFENAEWFNCEIVDNTLYHKSNLDIY